MDPKGKGIVINVKKKETLIIDDPKGDMEVQQKMSAATVTWRSNRRKQMQGLARVECDVV
jgi:hypothetical protein